jgi:hypothetical protein
VVLAGVGSRADARGADLALYAGWLLWREPSRWRWGWVAPVLVTVPLLWFGGDWLASGDPRRGAATAQVLTGTWAQRLVTALDRIGDVVIVPVWVAAAVGVVVAARRRMLTPGVLAAAALAWMTVVVTMAAVFGYAALSRFLLPAAAVLCVLAGMGTAWVVTAPQRAALRWLVAVALLAASLPFAVPGRSGWGSSWRSPRTAAGSRPTWTGRSRRPAGGRRCSPAVRSPSSPDR